MRPAGAHDRSESAIADLRRLGSMGFVGPMGFYESIDFTRETKRDGEPGVVIYPIWRTPGNEPGGDR